MIPWKETTHLVDIDLDERDWEIGDFFGLGSQYILRALFESISDGVLVLDAQGKVVHLNKRGAVILGLDQAASIGRDVAELVDFKPVILEVLANGQGYLEREIYIHSPSRGRLRFLKSAIVLRDRRSRILGVIDTFRPIEPQDKLALRMASPKARYSFSDIVGKEPVFLEAINLSRIAAESDANVLIEGESGTGKEMFAHAIHQASARASGPLVIVNCASLPPSLIESELFGYESGSFTGARKEGFSGKFEQADGGTIVLDEIGEMPPDMQAKLLRVLQDKSFTRIGGTKTITVNTRVIAATNKNLADEISKGRFREDLYYRLNVLCVRPPPLRERLDDIPLLVSHLAMKGALHYGRAIPEVDGEVLTAFREYSWPGNVRELENVIERAIIVSETNRITMAGLPNYILTSIQHRLVEKNPKETEATVLDLEDVERNAIRQALKETEGNISICAKRLGISRNTLYRKMRQYSL
ncbi:MAG: sigma 54-interacting transcriptional regulator [Spirochaetes bacterium]|nr:sigma 54-interacting transcriptional regulator [Spirochaetota bacterium]